MYMSRSITLLFILLVFFSGCRNKGSGRSGEHKYVIATLKGPSSMGMIRLIDSLEKTDGGNCRVEILNEPLQVRKMMLDGTADLAILPTTMAAVMYNKGLDYQVIAIPVWGSFYLCGSDSLVKSWDELKGKRVFVMAKGMTPDMMFRYLLEINGLSPDNDVILDYSFPTHLDIANAVAAGRADPAVISEPQASMVMRRNKEIKQLMDLNLEWQKSVGQAMAVTSLLVRKEMADENPQLLKELIEEYQKSTDWVNKNCDSAALLMVTYNIMPDYQAALEAIPRSNLKFVEADSIKNDIEEYLGVFFKMNPETIGGKIPDEGFIYP